MIIQNDRNRTNRVPYVILASSRIEAEAAQLCIEAVGYILE